MHQKATKYASLGNNVLLKYIVLLFFPRQIFVSPFNFLVLFLIFNLTSMHLQQRNFFGEGGSNEVDLAHLSRYTHSLVFALLATL